MFATEYLKDKVLHFIDINDGKVIAELVIDNFSHLVTYFEKEMIKKNNKHTAKKKAQLKKLYTLILNSTA